MCPIMKRLVWRADHLQGVSDGRWEFDVWTLNNGPIEQKVLGLFAERHLSTAETVF